jgi:hypothetical protein
MNFHKYHAVPTIVDGVRFASKAEARRYGVLKMMQMAGEISGLELQPKFPLVVNGEKICFYVADFRYVKDGQQITEDVKGMRTAVYRIKAKLLKALHGIVVTETT